MYSNSNNGSQPYGVCPCCGQMSEKYSNKNAFSNQAVVKEKYCGGYSGYDNYQAKQVKGQAPNSMPWIPQQAQMPYPNQGNFNMTQQPQMPYMTQQPQMPYMTQAPQMPYMTQQPQMPYMTQQPQMPIMTQAPREPQKKGLFVFFFADWCGHCKTFRPKWEDFKKSTNDYIFIDIEETNIPGNVFNPRVTQKLTEHAKSKIRGFPTILLITSNNGEYEINEINNRNRMLEEAREKFSNSMIM
jgi:thiol-disulfide isomerase/thioredoxin